ncbi:MAG: class III extradiol dioxygenase family protein [Actinomycetota bacterium]|jgi:protocatechuate 4,5-dioxygenase beta chain|nr:class III extradiol dioxygenase family protein [Actinomycetota bacterium]
MARIVGSIMSTHVPSIAGAMSRHAEGEPYWKPFFDGYEPVRAWLDEVRPDVAVVVHNDHGLNFFLDKMPTFAVGCAPQYLHADEGWGIPEVEPFPGDPQLSWHLVESLIGEEFDLTTCQEMLVDHAVTNPMQLCWPDPDDRAAIRIVPVTVNTVMFPYPSARRCYALGEAIGRAITSYDAEEDLKVVLMGTGGLSHQLEGRRAGFINKEFDLRFLESLTEEPAWATQYSGEDLVRLTGSQGVELLMWLTARAALLGGARKVTSNYHIPISNTAAGTVVLEPAA